MRPLVLCSLPEGGRSEILPESKLVVEDPFFRRCEWELRRNIYRWCHIKDDEIIDAKLFVLIEHALTDWIGGRVRSYSERADGSAQLSADRKLTQARLSLAMDCLGDMLAVTDGEPFFAGRIARLWGGETG